MLFQFTKHVSALFLRNCENFKNLKLIDEDIETRTILNVLIFGTCHEYTSPSGLGDLFYDFCMLAGSKACTGHKNFTGKFVFNKVVRKFKGPHFCISPSPL